MQHKKQVSPAGIYIEEKQKDRRKTGQQCSGCAVFAFFVEFLLKTFKLCFLVLRSRSEILTSAVGTSLHQSDAVKHKQTFLASVDHFSNSPENSLFF